MIAFNHPALRAPLLDKEGSNFEVCFANSLTSLTSQFFDFFRLTSK